MPINKDDELFYVTTSGQINQAIATSNERNGAVEIKIKTGNAAPFEIGTFHLFRTPRAAEIASSQRRNLASIKKANHGR